MKTIKYDRFLGMNTKLPDYSLTVGDKQQTTRWVRDALNVDFRNDGTITRRRAFSVIPGTDHAHSVFEDMVVSQGVLYRFATDPFTLTMLQLLSNDNPMSYCRVGDTVYMSNGQDGFRLTPSGELRAWALDAPTAPIVEPTPGALSAGRYTIQISYSNADEEGVLSEAVLVETDEVQFGGFRVHLPAGVPSATYVNVYISGNDGATPLLYDTVRVGEQFVDITQRPEGREAHRRIETPLPAGTRLFEFNGRLCSVVGRRIWYSVPYRHGYCEPESGYVEFESDVKIAVGNQGGVYVAAAKTHFLAGQDIASAELVRDVLNYSATPGTEFAHPEKPLVGWFGADGLVLGSPEGEAQELMADKVNISAPEVGCSLVTHNREATLVFSCGWVVNLENGAVSRYDVLFDSASGAYATNADGLIALDGDAPVEASVDLGMENFGVENEKRLPAIYLGAASEGPLSINVVVGDSMYSYDARSYSSTLNVERIDPGKGLRANWFNISLTNPEGVDFELASLHFAPTVSTRRI